MLYIQSHAFVFGILGERIPVVDLVGCLFLSPCMVLKERLTK